MNEVSQDDQTGHAAARTFVVNSLAARAQSVAEIEAKLAAQDVPADIAAAVVDEAPAAPGSSTTSSSPDSSPVDTLARLRPAAGGAGAPGPGCSRGEASGALEEAYGDADEVAVARAALGSRTTADAKTERRAVAFLVRRGFSPGAAWAVVRERRGGGRKAFHTKR